MSGSENKILIGNCSGFYGDRLSAAKDMVEGGPLDVLTGDYLAELTMTILYNQRMQRGEDHGYVGTFLKQFKDVLSSSNDIYVSIDLDVIDPAFAPGVGNPEANGMSTREILEFIYCIDNFNLKGFDIVELIPAYDNGSTSVLAARLLSELICITDKQ